MLQVIPPAEAYRRVELDALVLGGDARQLIKLCLAEAVGSLDRALLWHDKGDRGRRNSALAKAISGIQALRMGIDQQHPLGGALLTLYGSAAARLTRTLIRFDASAVAQVSADLNELADAFGIT